MSTATIQNYTPGQSKVRHLWQRIGFPASHGPRLIQALEHGLSVTIVDKVVKEVNVPQAFLFELTGIKARNFARRKASGKLNPEEGERLARYVRVVDAAIGLMSGDRLEALAWLNEPALGLNGQTPSSLVHTETGALEVMQLIGRIRHGVFA
jgi:putative toxin-antitoxin system antitoxin component (TIGR02293 family)